MQKIPFNLQNSHIFLTEMKEKKIALQNQTFSVGHTVLCSDHFFAFGFSAEKKGRNFPPLFPVQL